MNLQKLLDLDKNDLKIILKCLDEILLSDLDEEQQIKKNRTQILHFEQYEQIISYIDDLADTYPNNSNLLARKGLAYQLIHEYETSLHCYNEVLKVNNNEEIVIRNLGFTLLGLEKYDEGIIKIDQALIQFPNDSKLLLAKAYSLEMLDKFTESMENYIQAFKIDTNNPDQLYDLGFFIKQNGQTEAGQNYLDNGSSNDKLRNTINHLFENDPKIIKLYRKYLKRNPDAEGIEFFQKQMIKGKSLDWVESEIKNSDEGKYHLKGKEYGPKIIEFHRKYLKRNPDAAGMAYFIKMLDDGKTIDWLESTIKDSVEAKELK